MRSKPIVEADWSIRIEGASESVMALASHRNEAENSGGPVLVQNEVAPAPANPGDAPVVEAVKPAEPVAASAPIPSADPAHQAPAVLPLMSYAEAYRAVPFSRSEYEANPGYRHEAALELMFQQLRPMTVMKQYSPRAFRYPDFYQYPYARYPYQRFDIRQSAPAGIPYPLYAR